MWLLFQLFNSSVSWTIEYYGEKNPNTVFVKVLLVLYWKKLIWKIISFAWIHYLIFIIYILLVKIPIPIFPHGFTFRSI